MAEAGHTLGPWQNVPSARGGEYIETQAHVDADGGRLPYLIECPGTGGAMSYSQTVCQLHWSGTHEWRANARLIASSPALLEALEAAREAMETWCATYAADECSDENVAAAKQRIREGGGTLGYIADVNAKIDAALAQAREG